MWLLVITLLLASGGGGDAQVYSEDTTDAQTATTEGYDEPTAQFCVFTWLSWRCFALYLAEDGVPVNWDAAFSSCIARNQRLAIVDHLLIINGIAEHFGDVNDAGFRRMIAEGRQTAWVAGKSSSPENYWQWTDGTYLQSSIPIELDGLPGRDCAYAAYKAPGQLSFVAVRCSYKNPPQPFICAHTECPSNSSHLAYETNSGMCLVFNPASWGTSSWYETNTRCERLGGRLATLTDGVSRSDLIELLRQTAYQRAYIGLVKNSKWKWILPNGDTQLLVDYFMHSNPYRNADCVSITVAVVGSLRREICSNDRSYICEWDTDDIPPTKMTSMSGTPVKRPTGGTHISAELGMLIGLFVLFAIMAAAMVAFGVVLWFKLYRKPKQRSVQAVSGGVPQSDAGTKEKGPVPTTVARGQGDDKGIFRPQQPQSSRYTGLRDRQTNKHDTLDVYEEIDRNESHYVNTNI